MIRVTINADPDKPTDDDLETLYAEMFGRLMDALNAQFIKLLREMLAGEFRVIDTRKNAGADGSHPPKFSFEQFRRKVFEINSKIDRTKVFKNIFKSMESVFNRVDEKVKKSISYQFKKEGQPIPTLTLKSPSEALKVAVKANTDLITTITKKQSELLAVTVQKAVRGATDFNQIVEQVMKQADKGKSYAEFVARDQAAKAYAAISEERQKKAGFPNFEWVCVNIPPTPAKKKGEVRPDHWEHNGKVYSWAKPPTNAKGQPITPGVEVNCRCKAKGTFRPPTG